MDGAVWHCILRQFLFQKGDQNFFVLASSIEKYNTFTLGIIYACNLVDPWDLRCTHFDFPQFYPANFVKSQREKYYKKLNMIGNAEKEIVFHRRISDFYDPLFDIIGRINRNNLKKLI